MANPNIASLNSVVGFTSNIIGISTTTPTVLVTNPDNSNTILKINAITAANKLTASTTLNVDFYSQAAGAGTSTAIIRNASIPSGATLVVIGKDFPLYLQENRSVTAYAGVSSSIDILVSYETIS